MALRIDPTMPLARCKDHGWAGQALSADRRYGCFHCLTDAGDTGPVYRWNPPARVEFPEWPPGEPAEPTGELPAWMLE